MNLVVLGCNVAVLLTLSLTDPAPTSRIAVLTLALVLNLFELHRIAYRA